MNAGSNKDPFEFLELSSSLSKLLADHAVVTREQLHDLLEAWLESENLPEGVEIDEARKVRDRLSEAHPSFTRRPPTDFVMPPPGIAEDPPPGRGERGPGERSLADLIGAEDPDSDDASGEDEETTPDSDEKRNED